jgi:hypothetical protein
MGILIVLIAAVAIIVIVAINLYKRLVALEIVTKMHISTLMSSSSVDMT